MPLRFNSLARFEASFLGYWSARREVLCPSWILPSWPRLGSACSQERAAEVPTHRAACISAGASDHGATGLSSADIVAEMKRIHLSAKGRGSSADAAWVREQADRAVSSVLGAPECFSAEALTATVNILEKAGAPDQQLLDKVCGEVVRRSREFGHAEITSMLWTIAKAEKLDSEARGRRSLTKLRTKYKGALKALQREILAKANDFEPREIATVLWSYATIDKPAADAFAALGKRVPSVSKQLKPHELSLIVWSYSKLRHVARATTVFAAVERELLKRADDFREQDLSLAAWAFGSRCFLPLPFPHPDDLPYFLTSLFYTEFVPACTRLSE
uniref:Uncharacterized protein n=1 Tax=Tetraselmis sp. GSL018 TaxID=582737 RepID=A0A061S443_9CHLO|mmetsp:Transcript_15300/g.36422  ORF Transcript_15300/g.36422 Transcript_15300/m.36422 type:complete len:332 (+) Transcript_15300:408-1403(+)|eukprot:CAMPEP_0177605642 /NCGR_PEP_ID=MMETSP0419_2-20121207/16820_1 /TAXON_ID=582737 /ORGANISM="Tetraselmis sp., Strain GSL018" /LENGTH=331 /DNA_ID=CAMNT_0019099825 /DNA_START=282 /DNA_END=1277 /DNA_ORIENTATION=-